MAEYKRIAVNPEVYQEIVAAANRAKRSIGGQVAFMVEQLKAAGFWVTDLGILPGPEGSKPVPVIGVCIKDEEER